MLVKRLDEIKCLGVFYWAKFDLPWGSIYNRGIPELLGRNIQELFPVFE
jgi:hypothetical protein